MFLRIHDIQKNQVARLTSVFLFALAVLTLSFFVPLFVPKIAQTAEAAANLQLSPSSGTYEVGETITVLATVSGDTPLNAVSGSLLFPPTDFSIQSVSKSSSILNFWVTDPTFSKGSGVVRFEGVTLGGFQGARGTVVAVTLKPLKPGTAGASFQNAHVLANDGQGTDITGSLSGATFTIVPAAPKPEPKPLAPQAPQTQVQTSEPEPSQPAPTLEAPRIALGSKDGALSIRGTSQYPNAQVLLTFVADDGVKIFITGNADSAGAFSILLPNALKHGTYTVTAVLIRPDNTNTVPSNTLSIVVGSVFSDLSWQIWVLICLLVVTVLYLFARAYMHFGNAKNLRKSTERQVAEVERVAEKSFDTLRGDIHEYEKHALSAAERKAISGIEKDIDSAEKAISKKINDIDE